ncbi:MAG TPA: hypothetical protein VJR02_03015 [Pyrinomonadaceae bacterium]|nr:hypothetical protein [Pyrinomonadaceae bacterium]
MSATPLLQTNQVPASPETHWKLEIFERALRKTARGAEIADTVVAHAEEIIYLVNHNRRVTVTWQRNHGPAFIIAIRDSLRDEDKPIPKEMNGVTLEHVLLHMADALQRAGSPALRRMIAERSLQVLLWARECSSVNKFFEQFESAGA